MINLDLGTIQINNPEIEKKSKIEIKELLINFLNNFSSTKTNKKSWQEIENEIKKLKTLKKDSSKNLEEAFDFLNKEFVNNGKVPYEELKDNYLSKKLQR